MSREKSWKEIAPAGVCSKSSVGFLTGDWKTYTPVRDLEKCTLCLTCVDRESTRLNSSHT